jgi:hypothetical protein
MKENHLVMILNFVHEIKGPSSSLDHDVMHFGPILFLPHQVFFFFFFSTKFRFFFFWVKEKEKISQNIEKLPYISGVVQPFTPQT